MTTMKDRRKQLAGKKDNWTMIFFLMLLSGTQRLVLYTALITIVSAIAFVLIYGPHAMAVNMGDDIYYGFYSISFLVFAMLMGALHD